MFWQRWSLIFLLVARLVIGELGHAMPMNGMSADEHASMAVTAVADCAEHEAGAMQMPSAHHGGDSIDANGDATGEADCCKSGDCECPCLHVPCAALDAPAFSPIATTLLRLPNGADGLISQRPSRVFRPPA
ncbi:MAG: CopL family metal-binding regulatory protein [Steroidobacter sp.]|nr:CopL family metal-binding regulatory protein [Steroidobacter sp.]